MQDKSEEELQAEMDRKGQEKKQERQRRLDDYEARANKEEQFKDKMGTCLTDLTQSIKQTATNEVVLLGILDRLVSVAEGGVKKKQRVEELD